MKRGIYAIDLLALAMGTWAGLLASLITTPIMLITAPAAVFAVAGIFKPDWLTRRRVLRAYVHGSAILAFASALFTVLYMFRP